MEQVCGICLDSDDDDDHVNKIHYKCRHWMCSDCHSKMDLGSGKRVDCPFCRRAMKIYRIEGPGLLQVEIKSITGLKSYMVNFCHSLTVGELKIMFLEKVGSFCDINQLVFRFAGRQLANNWTLGECNIQQESIIHYIARLCGD